MVGRLLRNSGLPQVERSRVTDPLVQRALDAVFESLSSAVDFLQSFAQQERWQVLEAANGTDWARVSATITGPQFVKDPLGRVELAGAVKSVSGGSTTIAVLPVGYRPALTRTFVVGIYNAGRSTGTIDIQNDGRVILITPAVAANIEVYLDAVRFDTRV